MQLTAGVLVCVWFVCKCVHIFFIFIIIVLIYFH